MHSQTSGETCIDNDDLKRVLIAAEEGKTAKQKVVLYEKQIVQYEERIANLQEIIKVHDQKDSTQKLIVDTYKREIVTYENEIKLHKARIEQLEREVLKEKRKRLWTTIGAIFVIVVEAIVLAR